jgi:hypothetical protein
MVTHFGNIAMNKESDFDIHWVDAGYKSRIQSNPKYPDGIDIDISGRAMLSCVVKLPYPAPRVGMYQVWCKTCGFSAGVTAAGRPDDPRSVRVPCKKARGILQ